MPVVTVPMNFGIQLLSSPTHSTLQLRAADEVVLCASSVILSFNSPVIDKLTTSLHLTTLDMTQFGQEAVKYFVDAAYTGNTPSFERHLFRDIYKIAKVYEVSWLAERCVNHFSTITDEIRLPSFADLLFIFEEAAFAVSQLKSRELVQIVFKKITSLDWKRQFIKQYLFNLSGLSKHQLDLIIELAGSDVHLIVQPLLRQLTEQTAVKNEVQEQPESPESPATTEPAKKRETSTQPAGEQFYDAGSEIDEPEKVGDEGVNKAGTGAGAGGAAKRRDTVTKAQPYTKRSGTLPRQGKHGSKEGTGTLTRPKKARGTISRSPSKSMGIDPLETALKQKEGLDKPSKCSKADSKKTGSKGTLIQYNCRYFLQNCDLSLCQKHHPELFENLFDVLQSKAAGSPADLVWLFQVLRKSSKQAVKTSSHETDEDRQFSVELTLLPDPRPSLTSAISIEQTEDLRTKDVVTASQRVIPNLFQTLNFDQTFDELVLWLGSSQQVTNMLMFLEGLWTWLAVNKDKKVKCSTQMMDKIKKIKQDRRWRTVLSVYANFRHNTIYSEQFFDGLKTCEEVCGDAERGLEFAVMVEKTRYVSLRSLFLEAGKLTFHYDNLAVEKCGKPGKCGFMLQVVTSEDGYVSVQLCTEAEDYADAVVHYHEEIRADNMHFIARNKSQTFSFPLSWLGRPRVVENTVYWGSCRRLLNWADEFQFDVLLSM